MFEKSLINEDILKREKEYTSRGTRCSKDGIKACHISYEVFGAPDKLRGEHGEPVLLVHDLKPGSGAWQWKTLAHRLSLHYAVYVPDLPGFGDSDAEFANKIEEPAAEDFYNNTVHLMYGKKDGDGLTPYLYTVFLKDFAKMINAKSQTTRVNLLAEGTGADYAVMAAFLFPECFGKLFLVEPRGILNEMPLPCSRDVWIKWLFEFPLIGGLLNRLMTPGFGIGRKIQSRYAAAAWYSKFLNINTAFQYVRLKNPSLVFVNDGDRLKSQDKVCKEFISFIKHEKE